MFELLAFELELVREGEDVPEWGRSRTAAEAESVGPETEDADEDPWAMRYSGT